MSMPNSTCLTCQLSRRKFLFGAAGASVLSGCDDPPALVSEQQIEAMGLEAWTQIRSETAPSEKADLRAALVDVSNHVLRAAGEEPGAWEVQLFASPQVNAFVLPGKKIGVFEGMFRVVANADQLAAIVGHEIGHLAAEHAQERVSAQVATNFGLRIIGRLLDLGEVEYADEIAAALGIGAQVGLLLPYSRSHELEADAFGLKVMADAGYEPRQAVELWRRMQMNAPARGPQFLATHPAPRDRISALEEILAAEAASR
jgi:predicted Zn-dependent protease